MKIQSILEKYQNASTTQQLIDQVAKEKDVHILTKFNGASLSFLISESFKQTDKTFLLIFDDKETAAYHLNDLERLINDKDVLFYPGSYRRPYEIEDVDNANVLMRAEVLNRLNSRKKTSIIVTYPNALFEKVVTKKDLNSNTFKITTGDEFSIDFINEVLFEYKFNRVDFVTEPGEFAVRGGIVDVFSFANDEPYRLEFFGDEIDSIRTFDVESQLSTGKPNKIHIMPNVENKQFSEKRESFLKFIPNNSIVFTNNMDILLNDLNTLFEKASTRFQNLSATLNHTLPSELFLDGIQIKEQLKGYNRISIQNSSNTTSINGQTEPQPSFNKHFNLLIENLQQNTTKGYTNYLFCASEKQAQRFHDIFNESEHEQEIEYETIVFQIHQGFVDHQHKIACYTDHQIFERYNKFQLKNGFAKKQAVTLQEINNLEIGDFVTHIDHGIGKFGGLQKIDVNGKKQEAIKLIYGDADVLYISIHSLHKISKFTGKDGKEPKVHKLGSPAWKKAKQKAKTRVKQIAFDLIQLYAKRKNQIGFRYDPDSYLQHELEASFMYEDTPDQFTATQDVKADMESDKPMDRLVCGDVGFGKTEVAIRAAFKAVDNSKQVAVLVPTTILAFQHFKSFKKRLEDLPVNINYLNRFKTAKQKRIITEDLAEGRLDIIIGTHQLVSDKIKYKDLGLLIIDEEQKFGVAAKDKLKTIKENVDTLTLTATPIPRTLQFSLMAARDLSVIATPPPNRHPIETNVISFSEETIRDAVMYEISRGGQIFFIHNRVDNIKEVAGMLQRLVPDAKIGIGHGQLEGRKLEEVMVNFMEGAFDILVATTIIESGLDVPNANTIFINHANNFGLSDLHQMRGRVGRSNKKAFCYFICPPYHMMTEDARKRIQALEMFSELGSGINIAMKDLEIRGAGDLLGGEQSGFITDIGFDTYQKILEEAVKELKENEFKDLYNEEEKGEKEFVSDIQIDTDFEILFPDDYVNSISERLTLYKKLGELTEEIQLQEFEKHLTDRFGEIPTQVVDLLDSVRIKWLAKKLGIEKLVLKQKRMIGYFVSNQQSEYYTTQAFTNVLKYVQNNSKMCVMKEKETKTGLKLLITFIRIDSIKKALEVLRNI
ncbi:transcription-repair coupling factor (superfamily II helicase) [Wenyingzhuangia heitensis]|uniref:Transcription-repair-coupling factor n=1 Tax=Wenyingzhuangia heitensis TaxID=1487859 RepID=A0ABX0U7L4_9FLAO|nr:transcription-repair coupling factor [Wenyingzhuangia heitensis]NIJ43955.1 transcription-repair coupling factor (superfamily II helicase) [Wenyingzhuangia heitensis]